MIVFKWHQKELTLLVYRNKPVPRRVWAFSLYWPLVRSWVERME